MILSYETKSFYILQKEDVESEMKKLICAVLILFAATVAVAQPELSVLTCNMMGMKPGTKWEKRLQLQIEQIGSMEPDIIFLQEVCETPGGNGHDNMARTLTEGLTSSTSFAYDYYFSPTDMSWGNLQEGIAIVTRHPIKHVGYLDLPPGDLNRKVVWVQVATEFGPVNLFCTHLSYRDDHEHIRVNQIKEIHGYINRTGTSYPAETAIIGGDFNCLPYSSAYTAMTTGNKDHQYIDCYRLLHENTDGYTFPSHHPEKRIDYIFLRKKSNLVPRKAIIMLDKMTREGLYPSDHLSLLVWFGIITR